MRIALCLLCAYLLFATGTSSRCKTTKVKVAQGWLEGERLETITGECFYYSFKGIPYAEPPVGKLRFKAPRPPLPWEGVRPAKNHGSVCPHQDVFTEEVIPGDENCLFLNVYSPNINPEKPLPVMFFIHGGGFKSGSGDDTNYAPDFIVCHDTVLVTINYRLAALGFLCLDTPEVPGNAGLKDQVAALKWVKENIVNFGGDPDNITVFGQSAGGVSTALHLISPMSKGLFHRAIIMSGVPFCEWALPHQPRRRAFMLGKLLGTDTNDPNELLKFLQQVSIEELVTANPNILASEEITNNIFKMYHFTPVVENNFGSEYFLIEEPAKALKNGNINVAELLIGYTSEETLVGVPIFEKSLLNTYARYIETFVPREILVKSPSSVILDVADKIKKYYFDNKPVSNESMREFVTYANQEIFIQPIYKFMGLLQSCDNVKRFMYKFSCVSNRNVYGQAGNKYGIIGTSHLDDLMYLFDAKVLGLKYEKGSNEAKMINLVCTVFTNFAKYGTPTPDSSLGITWPEYDHNIKNYVNISDTLTIEKENEDFLTFWDSIFEYTGN